MNFVKKNWVGYFMFVSLKWQSLGVRCPFHKGFCVFLFFVSLMGKMQSHLGFKQRTNQVSYKSMFSPKYRGVYFVGNIRRRVVFRFLEIIGKRNVVPSTLDISFEGKNKKC